MEELIKRMEEFLCSRRPKSLGGGHIDCPCWSTGVFVQVPCLMHDGHFKYPKGAYEASLAKSVDSGREA